jgi:hypothetical protein
MEADGDVETAEHGLLAPGDHDVCSQVICVLTRFGLKRPWHLLQAYVSYRWLLHRVRRDPPPGFLHATFLVDNLTTGYSLSLWTEEAAIARFGTAFDEHVDVAGGVFGRLRVHGGDPELWSTKWRLFRVSRNLSWDGLDLRGVLLAEQPDLRQPDPRQAGQADGPGTPTAEPTSRRS